MLTPDLSSTVGAGLDCVVCGVARDWVRLHELSRRICRCTVCGLVYAEPSSDPAHTEYPQSYYKQGVYADYLGDRLAIGRNALQSLAKLERLVAGRRLLDVGCAAGFFLLTAQERGWVVQGLEVSDYALSYASNELKLPIAKGSIVSPPESLGPFDVITLWDTIEHLDRPDLALRNIQRLLNSDGLLVISTGDYGSLLRRVTGRRWRLFLDPTHNFFFDEFTLSQLLKRTGFGVVSVTRKGKWVSLSTVLHQSPLPFADRARRWLSARDLNPSIYVNLRDVMTFVARPSKLR